MSEYSPAHGTKCFTCGQVRKEHLPGYQPPFGTCDWGACNERAMEWRWDEEYLMHLPVCNKHSVETAFRESQTLLATLVEAAQLFVDEAHCVCPTVDEMPYSLELHPQEWLLAQPKCIWHQARVAIEQAEAING